MQRVLLLVLSVALSGCYASHLRESDAGSVDGSTPDAGACFEAESDLYLRNDCEFCNALHYSWLRRCGSTIYVAGGFSPAAQTSYQLGPCGELTMLACVRDRACLPASECEAVDVDTLEALLDLRTEFSPRGGALPFEPFDPESDLTRWLTPPECDALADDVSVCE
ncbi:MAG: hypothetical protein AB8I08_13985 [Sandaracinaceae bacterium]